MDDKIKNIFYVILTAIISLIPVLIMAISSGSYPNIWTTSYAKFVFIVLGINLYFAIFLGTLEENHSEVAALLYLITTLVVMAIVIISYIILNKLKGEDTFLFHIGSVCLFELNAINFINLSRDDKFYWKVCAAASVIVEIYGLINVLWLNNVCNFNVIIMWILNFIFIGGIIFHFVETDLFSDIGDLFGNINYDIKHSNSHINKVQHKTEQLEYKAYLNARLKDTETKMNNK